MANVLAPFGFTPVRRLDGAAWTGNQSQYKIASNNNHHFYQGDVVQLLNTGYIDLQTASTNQVIGVFVGCEYLSTAGSRRVWSNQFNGDTSVDVIAYVIDDPLCVFLAQTGGASGSAIPLSAVGENIQITTTTAGSNFTGISGMAADENVLGTATTTLPFRVVGIPGLSDVTSGTPYLAPPANGYDQTTKYNLVLVAFNNQMFRTLTGI
jgi:hypothetical protein